MEVLAIGGVSYEAITPCLVAAFVGDLTTRAWGVSHTVYRVRETPAMSMKGLLCAAVAGAVFGLVGMAFARTAHATAAFFKAKIAWAPLRPFCGGLVVALAVFAMGTTRYVGLGISTIVEAFDGRQAPWQWALKFLFTIVTLGAGFKGGEVTPLFFIGGDARECAVVPSSASLVVAGGDGLCCCLCRSREHAGCVDVDGGGVVRRRGRRLCGDRVCDCLHVLRTQWNLPCPKGGSAEARGGYEG